MFPISKQCSPTPRSQDNGPLAKTQPLTTGRGDKEQENFDTSEIHARRLTAKDVLKPQDGEECVSRFADGSVKLARREHVFRTSTLIQDHPARGEERCVFLYAEIGRVSNFRLIFWSISRNHIGRHHNSLSQ